MYDGFSIQSSYPHGDDNHQRQRKQRRNTEKAGSPIG